MIEQSHSQLDMAVEQKVLYMGWPIWSHEKRKDISTHGHFGASTGILINPPRFWWMPQHLGRLATETARTWGRFRVSVSDEGTQGCHCHEATGRLKHQAGQVKHQAFQEGTGGGSFLSPKHVSFGTPNCITEAASEPKAGVRLNRRLL